MYACNINGEKLGHQTLIDCCVMHLYLLFFHKFVSHIDAFDSMINFLKLMNLH